MREVDTQIATSLSADFEEGTWTFLMPKGFQVWAGEFAIVDKQVYDRMKSIIAAERTTIKEQQKQKLIDTINLDENDGLIQ